MNCLIYHHRTQATDAQGIHIQEICKAFNRLGWQVNKVALVDDEAVGKESREGAGFRFVAILPAFLYEFLELGYNLVGIWRLWMAVRVSKPRFIYERYSIFNVTGAIVSMMTGVPLILEVNAPLAREKKEFGTLFLQRFAQQLETWVINRSFRTIAVTSVLRSMLIEKGAIPNKVVVVPNGVNLEDFHHSTPAVVDSEDSPLTIGFVGWFRSWHGLKELIEALAADYLKTGSLRLLLVGDGPARGDIEKTIARLGVGGGVEITGAVTREEVIRYLSEIDVALQPASTEYASPMKLIEYMAAGKAIVAVDQENIRELLEHEKNALLFPSGDWNDLKNQIGVLCDNKSLVNRLGLSAREEVRRRPLTWDENARRVLGLFS